MFFPINIKNATSDSKNVQLEKSCIRLNEQKSILKNNQALVSRYKKPN